MDFLLGLRYLRSSEIFSPAEPPSHHRSVHQSAPREGKLIRGFGHASHKRGLATAPVVAFSRFARTHGASFFPSRPAAAVSLRNSAQQANVSFDIGERPRVSSARKMNGCSRSLATVSCLYGTEPITRVGFSRQNFVHRVHVPANRQTFGSLPTGATSAAPR